MEELKVSIVVPVYNTNIEYFRQCIKSLVLQTYEKKYIMMENIYYCIVWNHQKNN